jgi:hypothetical protein
MKVARGLIRDSDPVSLADLHVHKLAAFLFVTNAYPTVEGVRSWRIALLILAAAGFAAMRDPWMRNLLAAILAYQVASYVPVLYTHRYSVTMDPWLMIAAGVGVASLWSRRRPREIVAVAGAIAIGIGIGRYLARHMEPPEPDIFAGARMLVWKGEPRRITFDSDHPVIEIPIPNAPWFHPWNPNVLLLDVALTPAPGDAACGKVRFTYRRETDSTDEALVRNLVADGRMHRRQLGMVALRLNAPGTLRMELQCAKGGSLDIGQVAVYTPVAGIAYAQRYLGLPPPLKLPIEE